MSDHINLNMADLPPAPGDGEEITIDMSEPELITVDLDSPKGGLSDPLPDELAGESLRQRVAELNREFLQEISQSPDRAVGLVSMEKRKGGLQAPGKCVYASILLAMERIGRSGFSQASIEKQAKVIGSTIHGAGNLYFVSPFANANLVSTAFLLTLRSVVETLDLDGAAVYGVPGHASTIVGYTVKDGQLAFIIHDPNRRMPQTHAPDRIAQNTIPQGGGGAVRSSLIVAFLPSESSGITFSD